MKAMEIPRNWREQPTNMRFEGKIKEFDDTGLKIFKFPGGEIPLAGTYEQISERFLKRGFGQKVADEVLFQLWGGVSAETAITLGEVTEGFFKLSRSEVGK